MSEKTRICAVCGNQYEYCPHCNKDKDKPTWMFCFHDQNCHDIYDVTSKYEDGQISANEAKESLSKLDLSKKDNFGTSYKNAISKILSEADVNTKVEETEPEKKIVKKTSTKRKVKAEDVE